MAVWKMFWWGRPAGKEMNYRVISLVWIRGEKTNAAHREGKQSGVKHQEDSVLDVSEKDAAGI